MDPQDSEKLPIIINAKIFLHSYCNPTLHDYKLCINYTNDCLFAQLTIAITVNVTTLVCNVIIVMSIADKMTKKY